MDIIEILRGLDGKLPRHLCDEDVHPYRGCPRCKAASEIESLRTQLQQSEARVKDLLDFVETAREILDQYADADCGQDGYEPNTEMRALVEADRLLATHVENDDDK